MMPLADFTGSATGSGTPALTELVALWRMSPQLLAVVAADGALCAASPAWQTALGYSPQRLLGQPLRSLAHPQDIDRLADELARVHRHGRSEFLLRCRHADGSYRDLAWTAVEHQQRLIVVGHDVTAHRAAAHDNATQAALLRAQKLQAVVRLSGGISHDFNNLLQVLRNTVEMIRGQPGDEARVRHWAESALRVVDRGARLTAQLLAFCSAQQLRPRAVMLVGLLQGLQETLQRSLGPLVRVELAVGSDAGCLLADPQQLELALLNLALNAGDAMPDGGQVTLSGGRQVLRNDPDVTDGEYIVITVTDSGHGMTEAVRERAFEPFFTTKGVGQGTGLGLAQVYGFARQSGGSARIAGTSPLGTSVSVVLPALAAGAAGPSQPPDSAGAAVPQVAEIGVLVVDDDADVRRFLSDGLHHFGYRVVQAVDGLSALAAIERHAPELMVVNIGMPSFGGARAPDPGGVPEPGFGGAGIPESGGLRIPGLGAATVLGFGNVSSPDFGGATDPGFGGATNPGFGGAIKPGFGGAEVARLARLVQPGLPIVFVSGHGDSAAARAVAGPGATLLRKPFDLDTLSLAVQRALAASA